VRSIRLLAASAWVFAAGCTHPNHPHDLRIREQVPSSGDGWSVALLQSVGVPMLAGNAVELIEDGRIFDAMEEEILNAEKSIHIFTYIWRPGEPSTRILNALRARRPGVACRIVYDPFGSIDFEASVRRHLSDAGCDVRAYRPFGPSSPELILWRTHRRMLVFDGKVGITGGFGIWRSWEGRGTTPEEWRDSNVRVLGPAVRDMQIAFARDWQEAGGGLLPADEFPDLAPIGEARAAFMVSSGGKTISNAERLTQLAIAAAERRLWIANAYFIPSTAISDSLIRKAQQGVDVRVIVPGPVHDMGVVRAAQRSTYKRLLKNGVRISEYAPSMLHSKTMLIDEELVVIGTINLDSLAMRRNEENALIVESRQLAEALELSNRRDLARSVEVRWNSWKRRGLLDEFFTNLSSLVGEFL
jgi:cardiolipin synthase